MISKNFKITNPSGLHLRPAGMFAQTAMKFDCNIKIKYNNQEIAGKSVLNIMAAAIKCGSEITVVCDGKDEGKAIEALGKEIKEGFDE